MGGVVRELSAAPALAPRCVHGTPRWHAHHAKRAVTACAAVHQKHITQTGKKRWPSVLSQEGAAGWIMRQEAQHQV